MTIFLRTGVCACFVAAAATGCRSTNVGGRARPNSAVSSATVPAAAPALAAGSQTSRTLPAQAPAADTAAEPLPVVVAEVAGGSGSPSAVRPAAHEQFASAAPIDMPVASDGDGLFAGRNELVLSELVALVEARNASLEAMTYAWRAATQRYPQAIALDDPVFMAMTAPASFSSSTVTGAYVVGGSQKLPWFGKRELRGAAAQSDASAMFHDVQSAQLELAQTTRQGFYEYYLLSRELELNQQRVSLLEEFRDTARVKYENNQVTEQDVLQADVELAEIGRRRLELERMYRVAVARINTLLRRNPDDFLPPAPALLADVVDPPPVLMLREMAVAQRPDLAALRARVRSEEVAVNLARKQYFPDTEVYGRYDSFWQPAATQGDLRGQVGVNMNMPIYRRKLQAAVTEAQFRVNQRRAEYQQKVADVRYEVQAAYEQVLEARLAVDIYVDKLLPVAAQNLDVARSNYDVGKSTFLNLLVAQQQLLSQREQYQQALASYHSRLAELQRVVGGPLPPTEAAPPEEVVAPLAE
ncbi:MAG TPA: TolC family protein [Pirellulales bacterium]|nr:TolC family protein [Pirellulales bacterium]